MLEKRFNLPYVDDGDLAILRYWIKEAGRKRGNKRELLDLININDKRQELKEIEKCRNGLKYQYNRFMEDCKTCDQCAEKYCTNEEARKRSIQRNVLRTPSDDGMPSNCLCDYEYFLAVRVIAKRLVNRKLRVEGVLNGLYKLARAMKEDCRHYKNAQDHIAKIFMKYRNPSYIAPRLREEANPLWAKFNEMETKRVNRLNQRLQNPSVKRAFDRLSDTEQEAIIDGTADGATLEKWEAGTPPTQGTPNKQPDKKDEAKRPLRTYNADEDAAKLLEYYGMKRPRR
jgi:hypothetical protein